MYLKEFTSKELPKVTVIIPCYNREKYIKDTIESVLAQTYPNLEIVAVDDGSKDNSRRILESLGKKIRVLEHPGRVNKGQSAAINLGIHSTKSEYIAILDSDDLFAPEKIERQVEFLKKNPKFGVVYSNGYYIDQYGNKLFRFYPDDHVELSDPERILLDCYFLLPNNSLVRRKVFEQVGGFDESLRSAQDHDMAIRVGEKTRIGFINEDLFFYRRHSDSISQKKAMLRWENGFYILEKAKKRYPYRKSVLRKRQAVLHFRLGQCYLEEKALVNALYNFTKAGLLDPTRSLKILLGKEKISSHHS